MTKETDSPPLEFVPDPIQQPLTQQLVNGSAPALKRSYFEDDLITADTYTTVVMMGDIKCFVREFTGKELKAFRNAARIKAVEIGLDGDLVNDSDAFTKALAALPLDAEGRSGIEQYALKMADTFNSVIVEHLRGWEVPKEMGHVPCTREKKLKLWPSNKFEFCFNLQQLGGLSAEDANTLKNS